jgi:uncharacterized protein (TIGR00369 family)
MTGAKLTAAQEKRIRNAMASVPYAKLLAIKLDNASVGAATLSLRVRNELKQNHGVVHGGAIASLIDSATAFAILTVIQPDEHVTTVDLTISYLRPVTKGRMTATSKVIRAGRRIIAVSAEVFNSEQTLIATSLSTFIKL